MNTITNPGIYNNMNSKKNSSSQYRIQFQNRYYNMTRYLTLIGQKNRETI